MQRAVAEWQPMLTLWYPSNPPLVTRKTQTS